MMVPRATSIGQRRDPAGEPGPGWQYELGTPWFGVFVAVSVLVISVLIERF